MRKNHRKNAPHPVRLIAGPSPPKEATHVRLEANSPGFSPKACWRCLVSDRVSLSRFVDHDLRELPGEPPPSRRSPPLRAHNLIFKSRPGVRIGPTPFGQIVCLAAVALKNREKNAQKVTGSHKPVHLKSCSRSSESTIL